MGKKKSSSSNPLYVAEVVERKIEVPPIINITKDGACVKWIQDCNRTLLPQLQSSELSFKSRLEALKIHSNKMKLVLGRFRFSGKIGASVVQALVDFLPENLICYFKLLEEAYKNPSFLQQDLKDITSSLHLITSMIPALSDNGQIKLTFTERFFKKFVQNIAKKMVSEGLSDIDKTILCLIVNFDEDAWDNFVDAVCAKGQSLIVAECFNELAQYQYQYYVTVSTLANGEVRTDNYGIKLTFSKEYAPFSTMANVLKYLNEAINLVDVARITNRIFLPKSLAEKLKVKISADLKLALKTTPFDQKLLEVLADEIVDENCYFLLQTFFESSSIKDLEKLKSALVENPKIDQECVKKIDEVIADKQLEPKLGLRVKEQRQTIAKTLRLLASLNINTRKEGFEDGGSILLIESQLKDERRQLVDLLSNQEVCTQVEILETATVGLVSDLPIPVEPVIKNLDPNELVENTLVSSAPAQNYHQKFLELSSSVQELRQHIQQELRQISETDQDTILGLRDFIQQQNQTMEDLAVKNKALLSNIDSFKKESLSNINKLSTQKKDLQLEIGRIRLEVKELQEQEIENVKRIKAQESTAEHLSSLRVRYRSVVQERDGFVDSLSTATASLELKQQRIIELERLVEDKDKALEEERIKMKDKDVDLVRVAKTADVFREGWERLNEQVGHLQSQLEAIYLSPNNPDILKQKLSNLELAYGELYENLGALSMENAQLHNVVGYLQSSQARPNSHPQTRRREGRQEEALSLRVRVGSSQDGRP